MSEIKKEMTRTFNTAFKANDKQQAIQRAVVKNGIANTAENYLAKVNNNPVFSIDLGPQQVANQKKTGRCWLFAAMNLFRRKMRQDFNLAEDFELSQSYLFFWDKLEKANYFYENIMTTADEALDSRRVAFLLQTPQQDGGQWEMAVALFQKYGVVPKSVMPESVSSSNASELNNWLNKKLRKDAAILRGLSAEAASGQKEAMLQEVYNMLAISLGTPPECFDFTYVDADKHYHLDQQLTPQRFFDKYVGLDLDDCVNLIHIPTADKPFNQTYTVEFLGNVVGGKPVKYLNVEMPLLKELAIEQLKRSEPVWFSCDVNQSSSRELGIMSLEMYDMNQLFDTDFTMTKAERLDFGESNLTHAMLLTGVDLIQDKPVKWKVENSWGDAVGTKGYFVMSDAWMDTFAYQVIVRKDLLTPALLADEAKEPVLLPAWDVLR